MASAERGAHRVLPLSRTSPRVGAGQCGLVYLPHRGERKHGDLDDLVRCLVPGQSARPDVGGDLPRPGRHPRADHEGHGPFAPPFVRHPDQSRRGDRRMGQQLLLHLGRGIFSPPRLIWSLIRPTTTRCPLGSRRTTSPER